MTHIARLRAFAQSMTHLVAEHRGDEKALLDRGAQLLRELVAYDDWLPDAFAQPSHETYRQYLLHCDPLERFCVVSFVWRPGQRTPLHDHLTWGLVAQLRGQELCQEYAACRDRPGYAQTGEHVMRRGNIDRLSPALGDTHVVSNVGDGTSVSIHVYGANIGAVRRHVFDPATGAARDFVSGYHNPSTPNLWDRAADARH
jgi:predicted metal-dependent enzyme (double-stranded beta helix superfamily)